MITNNALSSLCLMQTAYSDHYNKLNVSGNEKLILFSSREKELFLFNEFDKTTVALSPSIWMVCQAWCQGLQSNCFHHHFIKCGPKWT